MYEHGIKVRFGFSGGLHAPVNVVVEKKGNGKFAVLCCAIFCTPRFYKSLKFFVTSITSLDPETTDILHTIRHVHRGSVWPTRETKPRFFCAWLWNSLIK